MPPRLIIQIWDNDKFSLDDYLGTAYVVITPLTLKPITIWKQLVTFLTLAMGEAGDVLTDWVSSERCEMLVNASPFHRLYSL